MLERLRIMKLIISYQDGSTEIIAVARCDYMEFKSDCIVIEYAAGNTQYVQYRDIRSIVIA